mmetsp:Transcript_5434/g.9695  ORF Transcript_5434/g.9695 Transcript_5434/m.9695 type:complete len:413 (-) Transcript_5434:306-1544(-)|eukprot:CAMPEP_0184699084 /NCGR_PEP_ID=MMETSP0313-20130426/5473_1 /TAXON_ID=2792 /ORGANISM="Porphyridium aerugineum, Strain SAG 1380-2" /LENGTH=412 /DNA_ID=CAMNT_0027158117 /DNA_START=344 /DNA_END=1582 /DNA_ORIENTATION=+
MAPLGFVGVSTIFTTTTVSQTISACSNLRSSTFTSASAPSRMLNTAFQIAVSTRTQVHRARNVISMKKDVVVVTGSSSGLGLEAAKKLAESGDYLVIMAVRSYSKAEAAMKKAGLSPSNYKIMYLDLASLSSVREFVANLKDYLKKNNLDLFSVVNNAATWHPKDTEPRFTPDGFEEHVGTNHLGHFLLSHLLIDDLKVSSRTSLNPRVIWLGTETHNPNSPAGKVPPRADLGDLRGLLAGLNDRQNCMIDGKKFEPTKAYKDSKVCNAITMKQMSDRYAYKGITVSIMFPGCVASSGLFREKRAWFNSFFPWFQKNITKQYVSNEEAGARLAAVAVDPLYQRTGAYWKWNSLRIGDGTMQKEGTNIAISMEAQNEELGNRLYEESAKMVGVSVMPKPAAVESNVVIGGASR